VIFNTLDVNSNKFLSRTELNAGFQMSGQAVDDATFEVLWKLADQDGDGGVSLAEFDKLCSLAAQWEENAATADRLGVRAGGGASRGAAAAAKRRPTSVVVDAAEGSASARKYSPGPPSKSNDMRRRQLSPNTQRGYENTLREARVAQSPEFKNLGNSEVIFNTLDVNSNKFLSRTELKAGFQMNGQAVDDATFEVLWKLADQDGDGGVSLAEFDKLCSLAAQWEENAAILAAIAASEAAEAAAARKSRRKKEAIAKKKAERAAEKARAAAAQR
jgi:Ca2+-binding EF-hand superfamily protein